MKHGILLKSSLIRLLPSAYQGGVYEPVNHSKANPFIVSDSIMKEISMCSGHNESSSKTGKNVFMVFFGQFVVEEVLNARQLSCPRNYFNIHIPSDHYYKKTGLKEMPFIRTKYDTNTGKSPNNPRKQLNSATAWIDGSAIYGTTNAVSQALRTFKNGLLVSSDEDHLYPSFNYGYLSYLSPSRNIDDSKMKKAHYRIGNPLAHENPFVLTINIIFYRWHNHLAGIICNKKEKWTDEQCFNEARKWVIATLQNVIVNEWLPSFLGEKLPEYIRYDPSIDPSISNAFQSAAMRFGHTLVPTGVYKRLKPNKCDTSVIRLCDSFYNAQEIIYNNSIESLIIGMAHQAAEREDLSIVDDLRCYMHGPPEFTRRDLMALNIQRGRDHGLPGYVVARKMLVPNENIGSLDFDKMAAISKSSYKNVIENTLTRLYSSMDEVDLFVGGLLEADDELGPVFKEIIREQFQRIRDGDRFWFENKENGIFTEDQIEQIRKTTMYDIILSVTQNIHSKDLQPDVFHVPTEDYLANLTCADHFLPYECKIRGKERNCFALPVIKSSVLKCSASVSVPLCSTSEPQTYDYFTGSGASFVLSFLFLFLFFIGSVIALFLLVHMRKKESLRLRQSVRQQRKVYSDENSCLATEWIGKSEGTRDVIIHFMQERKQMSITLLNKQVLRVIDLKHVQSVEFQVSAGSNLDYVLVRIAREYDLVLKFENPDEKEVFIEKLEACLGKIGIGRQRYEVNVSHMLKSAVTKAHRQAQLEKFFRVVFAQAFSIKHDDSETLGIDYNQAKEIVNIELTAYEFAEALSLRPEALFVKQMFALIDADGNGYISFREFLNVIVIFAKGSPEDKTKLMFDMYDIDHSGKLSRQEFSDMIRSLLELANQSLSSSQIEELIASMFSSAGLQKKQEITFDDFTHLLADHREELGYVQLSFNIGDGYKAAPASRKSIAVRAEETILRAYSVIGEENLLKTSKPASHLRVETKPVFYEKDPTKQQVNRIIRFIENNTSHIFWTILYTLVILGIFIQKAYYYSVEAEHTGLRRIAGYGLTITRGAASSMMFAFATILLTMCRNTITFLRETFFHKYIPFDAAISFHKFIAFWALIFTTIHAIGHGINFYHIGTQTVSDLQCLFPNFHLDPQKPPKFPYWLFQTITGITGVFLVIIMILMYVFAIQFARRHVFNAFWKTHNLYPLLYILMILHGIGHLIQPPIFYYYFLGPCVLFVLDRLISVSRKKVEISVLKAELLPSGVTHLEFKRPDNFEYKSGQWVRIACVPLNTNEYHPFTLSSAPHEENLSLHIRAVGPWTTNLRKVYDPNNLQQHAYPKIYLDGPYGEGHQDWFRYDVSVLVGGGIGITPFASILKDVVFKSSLKHKIFCKKIYFIWVTRSQKQFEWMTDILQEVEESDKNGLVDVHIFITQFYQKFDLRTTMLYICERHFQRVCGRSLFTGLRAKTHFGRPDFEVFLNSLRLEHSEVSKIGVFSCGPPPMTRSVELSCEELNKHEGAIFVHHYENF
ncbi:dual oxidase 2-like isoform X3 [Stegodyphus dumicola]|uniref:dual oxidase 2-like isoform X3 n=1 Tax=Stegodyphus dumicola TaxID=202533 RepID=UPI0015AF527E|nr:dual oxidase 2-like isoform X3 [Stegodyphus dumicola]